MQAGSSAHRQPTAGLLAQIAQSRGNGAGDFRSPKASCACKSCQPLCYQRTGRRALARCHQGTRTSPLAGALRVVPVVTPPQNDKFKVKHERVRHPFVSCRSISGATRLALDFGPIYPKAFRLGQGLPGRQCEHQETSSLNITTPQLLKSKEV